MADEGAGEVSHECFQGLHNVTGRLCLQYVNSRTVRMNEMFWCVGLDVSRVAAKIGPMSVTSDGSGVVASLEVLYVLIAVDDLVVECASREAKEAKRSHQINISLAGRIRRMYKLTGMSIEPPRHHGQ